MPFGQVMHITNFSRDWTVVKFNLAFAPGTDVELLRKTVKKIGTDMMEEPAFKPILMQPLKMQGVVDIKDSSLIVRFKFMARPKNPSAIQRMGVRRMYEQLPKVGIQFATPTMPFAMPGMMPMPTATTTTTAAAAPAGRRAAGGGPASAGQSRGVGGTGSSHAMIAGLAPLGLRPEGRGLPLLVS